METKIYMVFESVSVEFKSYYVVWKLAFTQEYLPMFASLNRTMQYGNKEGTSIRLKLGAV